MGKRIRLWSFWKLKLLEICKFFSKKDSKIKLFM